MTVTRPWSSLTSCSKTRELTSISVPSQSLHLSITRTSTLFPSRSSCKLAWQMGFSFEFVDVAAASNITWETAQTKSEFSLWMAQAPSPELYHVRSPFHGPFSLSSKVSFCLPGDYIWFNSWTDTKQRLLTDIRITFLSQPQVCKQFAS